MMNRHTGILYSIIAMGSFVSLYALGAVGRLAYDYVTTKQKLDVAERNISAPGSNPDTLFISGVSHKEMIGILSNACNTDRARVVEIQPAQIHQDEAVQYIDQHMTMQGSFVDLVGCLAQAEPRLFPAKITSLQFKKTKVGNREAILSMHVYYQYIILNE
jgi:hypothetical protein